ncbi:MAG: asparagine synthetase B, partial [Firmicutes bacterium]|nr:asparagine synthetase B [Bacillota bacterium]
MCGITGWIDWQEDLTLQREVVEAMNATLANRGPDASGIWLSPRAAIAHRRLIVVDPEGGGQPMVRRRGKNTYVITYNGE